MISKNDYCHNRYSKVIFRHFNRMNRLRADNVDMKYYINVYLKLHNRKKSII